ncbi:MAG: MobA/MobL family protein [Pseudomonadota bacterium]|nr:MobA/MobL family protein [Pseudomonadota bacterium]
MTTKWLVQQRQAAERDLAEALALGRKDAKRRADADREREAIDRDARKVGSAIRKAERAARKMHFPLRAYPAFVEGRREGRVRMKRFEQALALALPKKVGGGHTSSFHFRMRGRGLGTWRKAKGYPYRRGEAVRTVRYIFRENAREIANGGVVSSISEDPDRIASLLAALEELELTAGRGNATVYWSLVVSLPNELTSEQRLALLDEICAPFRELGLPFGAVLHAPDPDGDQRNNHAHVVGSWRPFRTKDDGSFEFADRTLAALNTPEAIYELRERASEAMNRAMIAAGHRRRFTPKSNAARGLPPVSKAKGKSSVGQKDRERKARALEGLLRERELRQKRKRALEALAASVGQIRDIIKVPFADALLGLLATERRIAAAQVPKPLKVVVPQLGVSVSPPLPDATESPVPAAYMLQQHDQRMPVSHEKPSGIDSVVGADALESHPATPTVEAVQGVAADAAKPDGRSVEQDDSKLSDSQATRTYPTNGAMNGQQPTTNSDQKPPHIVPRRIGRYGLRQALYDRPLTKDDGQALLHDMWSAHCEAFA